MNNRILNMIVIATACFAGIQATRADLPVDRSVYLYMYEVPGDPESDIVFSVTLDLEASDIDGYWVGWEITSIEVREPGTQDTVWIESFPMVDSPDGLWWVEHYDPGDPLHDEFTVPPLLEGTALAQDPLNDDLDYVLEGASYIPPPGGAPYDSTAAIDYTFTLDGEVEPKKDGDDEPVEMPVGSHTTQ